MNCLEPGSPTSSGWSGFLRTCSVVSVQANADDFGEVEYVVEQLREVVQPSSGLLVCLDNDGGWHLGAEPPPSLGVPLAARRNARTAVRALMQMCRTLSGRCVEVMLGEMC